MQSFEPCFSDLFEAHQPCRSSAGRLEASVNTLIKHHNVQAQQISLLLQKTPESGQGLDRASSTGAQPKLEAPVHPEPENSMELPIAGDFTTAVDPETADNGKSLITSSKNRGPTAAKFSLFESKKYGGLCSCVCHRRRAYRSPITLENLVGKFRLEYDSPNSTRCHCCKSSVFYIFYQFPKYLLWRCISLALQLNQFSGPELLLRVSCMLPPDHPLWHYATIGDLEVVKDIYSQRLASPYDVARDGWPALFSAIKQKSPDLALSLIRQRVDFDFVSEQGITASELLWDQAFSNSYGPEGLEAVKELIVSDDRIEDLGLGTLHKIVMGFICKDIRTVLAATTDSINLVDTMGRTPLHWAVMGDHHDAVRDLLAYGADPNIRDRMGLVAIDFVTSAPICRLLLDSEADIHNLSIRKNRYALQHAACRPTPVKVIDMLVAAGGDVNAVDIDNETALLNAIFDGHTEIAMRLIALGANVNAANASSRDSAVHFAAAFDRPKILPLLLEPGADYTAVNVFNRDLGHNAALFAGTEFIKVMAQSDLRRLSLDALDGQGKTATDYMKDRSVSTAREIGIHEAFQCLAVSLSNQQHSNGEDVLDTGGVQQLDIHSSQALPDSMRLPGAYPL